MLNNNIHRFARSFNARKHQRTFYGTEKSIGDFSRIDILAKFIFLIPCWIKFCIKSMVCCNSFTTTRRIDVR